MLLTVLERLVLLNILPKEGDFTTLKIVRKMREDLSFSEDEHKALKFVQEPDQLRWDDKAEADKEVTFGEKATDIIKETLKRLNDEKKLTEEIFSLYEKFIGE